jgi:hypothetical protein
MRYILTVEMESRYAETDARDIKALEEKIREYAKLVQNENNTSAKHLGLHMTIEHIHVEAR